MTSDFIVRRGGTVIDRSSGLIQGTVERAGQAYRARCQYCPVAFTASPRRAVLSSLVSHAGVHDFPIGTAVTRTTTRGGKHAVTVHWEGTVTHHLKTKVRVRWDRQNGARTVAVLDHYPHEIQEATP